MLGDASAEILIRPEYWIFLLLACPVILVAGIAATIKELRQEGFLGRTWALRAFFLLVTAGVGYSIPQFAPMLQEPPLALTPMTTMVASLVLFVLVFSSEIYLGVLNISALVFGAMIGIIVAHLAFFLLQLVIEPMVRQRGDVEMMQQYLLVVKLLLSVVFAYLFVLLIHKNRDRFNFIIPYVEFRRERQGASMMLVDTSAIIDGRLADLCESHLLDGTLVVPKFVLRELQTLADSGDKLKRTRGRRGIDMLNRLRKNPHIPVNIDEGHVPGGGDVDSKLIKLAETLGARIITTDINLNKVANVQGVQVININDIATAVRPVVLPGEMLRVDLVRPGEVGEQAVGYMDDGTMIVVENASHLIGSPVNVVVTRLLQSPTGRIIFAKPRGDEGDRPEKNQSNG